MNAVRRLVLLCVVYVLMAAVPALAGSSNPPLLTPDEWQFLEDNGTALEDTVSQTKEKLEDIQEKWEEVEETFGDNPDFPKLAGAVEKLKKSGADKCLKNGIKAMDKVQGQIKGLKKNIEKVKKGWEYYEKYKPDPDDPFRPLEQLANMAGDMEDLLEWAEKKDPSGTLKALDFPIKQFIAYYKTAAENFHKALKELDGLIKARTGNAIGLGVPNTGTKAKAFVKAFPRVTAFPYDKIKYPDAEFWADREGGVYVWTKKKWTSIKPGVTGLHIAYDGMRLAHGHRPSLDNLISRCNANWKAVQQARKRGKSYHAQFFGEDSCGGEVLLLSGIRLEEFAREEFVARYAFRLDTRKAVDEAAAVAAKKTLVRGYVLDADEKYLGNVPVTVEAGGVSAEAATRSGGYFVVLLDTPPTDARREGSITVNAPGLAPHTQKWGVRGQCNQWFSTQLPAGTQTAVDKAAIAITATRGAYDGPDLSGALNVGEIVALRGVVDIPGDGSERKLGYLTWQLFDASGRQVGEYFKQEDVYETGAGVRTRVRFLLADMEPGDYTVALTHQFAATPGVLAQETLRIRVERPVQVLNAWVTDTKGGSPKDKVRADKAPLFYTTFRLDPAVDQVDVTLTAVNAATGKVITTEDIVYDRKPDRDVQRTGLMVSPGLLAGVDKVAFRAAISVGGATLQGEADVAIFKPEGKLTVSAPGEMISGKMYRISLGVPSDFEPPFKVAFSGSGMRFKQSGDGLKGTLRGMASSTASRRSFSFEVTDARGFTAKGGDSTVVIPPEVHEAKNEPAPSSSSGYSGGGGAVSSYEPPSTGGGGDPGAVGKARLDDMDGYLANLCPPCKISFCHEAVSKARRVLGQQNMAEVGGWSESQLKAEWAELVQGFGQVVASLARASVADGTYAYDKYCAERTIDKLVDGGVLPPGTGRSIIASGSGGSSGGGSGSSGGGGYSGQPQSAPKEYYVVRTRNWYDDGISSAEYRVQVVRGKPRTGFSSPMSSSATCSNGQRFKYFTWANGPYTKAEAQSEAQHRRRVPWTIPCGTYWCAPQGHESREYIKP